MASSKFVTLDTHRLQYASTKKKKIIEFVMGLYNGNFVQSNGLDHMMAPKHLHMLDGYQFDKVVRIISRHAGYNWIQGSEEIWTTLEAASIINFNGTFSNNVIASVVQKCKNARAMSFTYWNAPSFASVLNAISSSALIELTVDLTGIPEFFHGTLDSLATLGKLSIKLQRLMIICNDVLLEQDYAIQAFQRIKNILEINAFVYILFSHESSIACMQNLGKYGYESAGFISMAENNPNSSETDDYLRFHRYYLFGKIYEGVNWYIGCRKQLGSNLPKRPMHSDFVENLQHEATDEDETTIERFEVFDISKEPHIQATWHLEGVLNTFVGQRNQNYTAQIFASESKSKVCCFPFKTYKNVLNRHRFNAPIWDVTRITRVIYLKNDTRFLFSNGLIFQLLNMGMEEEFMASMCNKTSPRFIFTCTTQDRRWINANRLLEFLKSVEEIEFHGYWFAKCQENIIRKLPKTLKSLVYMRMKTDRKVSIHLNSWLNAEVLQNIAHYQYDSRDTQEESLASIHHGMSNMDFQFNRLDTVLIAARQISDPTNPTSNAANRYKTSIRNFIHDLEKLTSDEAEIVIVLHENVKPQAKEDLGLTNGYPVLVPSVFGYRHGVHRRGDLCKLMTRYDVEDNQRKWSFILPYEKY